MNPEDMIEHIPDKYKTWVFLALLVIPYITRAYHAVRNGGGLRGIYRSILFGTNTPPKEDK